MDRNPFFTSAEQVLNARARRQPNRICKGKGTSVNLRLLLDKLRSSRKRDCVYCIFIDYENAYNSLLRDI
jgi:hypothetical protein